MSGWAGREVGPGPGEDCYSSKCEIFNINLIKFGSVTKTKLAGLVAGGADSRCPLLPGSVPAGVARRNIFVAKRRPRSLKQIPSDDG